MTTSETTEIIAGSGKTIFRWTVTGASGSVNHSFDFPPMATQEDFDAKQKESIIAYDNVEALKAAYMGKIMALDEKGAISMEMKPAPVQVEEIKP